MLKKAMARLRVTDNKMIEILKSLNSNQRTLVFEKSVLYYAKYVESSDKEKAVIDELLKNESKKHKLEMAKHLERSEKEKDELLTTLLNYLDTGNVDVKKRVNESEDSCEIEKKRSCCHFHMVSENEDVRSIFTELLDKYDTAGKFAERALEYYIDLVTSESGIVDFNLIDKKQKLDYVSMPARYSVTARISNENVKAILESLSFRKRNDLVETSMLYYAKYLEKNPNIKEFLYDADKVNSDEQIEGTLVEECRELDCTNMSYEELMENAKKYVDVYLSGIEIKDLRLLSAIKDEVTKMRFREYPPKKIEGVKFYCNMRFKIQNNKAQRMIKYAKTKTVNCGILIERAVEYYINLLRSDNSVKDFSFEEIVGMGE